MTYDNSLGGKCKVVDESMADQKSSLHSVPDSTAAHKQNPIDDDRVKPIGNKAMQAGNFD